MKIGVISDTHIPERALALPKEIINAFQNVDLIIHAGDFINLEALKELEKIKPVKAVYGNMDKEDIRRILKPKEIITIGKYKIGVIHGSGHPSKILDYAKNQFKEKLDILIIGHSHKPLCKKQDGVLYFNPGSPTDTIFAPYRSFGIITLGENEITGKIIKIS